VWVTGGSCGWDPGRALKIDIDWDRDSMVDIKLLHLLTPVFCLTSFHLIAVWFVPRERETGQTVAHTNKSDAHIVPSHSYYK
jgi:hypothetical protein